MQPPCPPKKTGKVPLLRCALPKESQRHKAHARRFLTRLRKDKRCWFFFYKQLKDSNVKNEMPALVIVWAATFKKPIKTGRNGAPHSGAAFFCRRIAPTPSHYNTPD